MRIDRPDDDDGHADADDAAGDAPRVRTADGAHGTGPDRGTPAAESGGGRSGDASAAQVARDGECRATVDAVFRAHAIDQGYARVKEIEERTVTPAMRRIEAEDPDRRLAGLEHRLKSKDRLYSYERGDGDNQFYEVTEDEANRIVERIRRSVTGQP